MALKSETYLEKLARIAGLKKTGELRVKITPKAAYTAEPGSGKDGVEVRGSTMVMVDRFIRDTLFETREEQLAKLKEEGWRIEKI